jgi:hypothetical protein
MEDKTQWEKKEKKEEELEDKVTICKPVVESVGCEKHDYEPDWVSAEGWQHYQCKKCSQGKYEVVCQKS